MATSGNYGFTMNKMQLLTMTLQSINVIDLNDTPDSNDYAYASNMLNMMLKMWEVDGIHLFKRYQATLFPQYGQSSYQLGAVSGADNVCLTSNYVKTTVALANPINVNTVQVSSLTGLIIGQNIGIEQDNQIRAWGVITNINTMTNVITGTFLTTTTCALNNTIVAYTNKINRPVEVIRATCLDFKANNSEVTLGILSYDEYLDYPIKNSLGRPNNLYYDRIDNGMLPFTSTMYLYNTPYKAYQVINFTYTDSLQQMLNSADNLDLPQEWLLPVMTNLAALLAGFGYGKGIELPALQQTAMAHLAILKNFDSDDTSLTILRDDTNHPNTL